MSQGNPLQIHAFRISLEVRDMFAKRLNPEIIMMRVLIIVLIGCFSSTAFANGQCSPAVEAAYQSARAALQSAISSEAAVKAEVRASQAALQSAYNAAQRELFRTQIIAANARLASLQAARISAQTAVHRSWLARFAGGCLALPGAFLCMQGTADAAEYVPRPEITLDMCKDIDDEVNDLDQQISDLQQRMTRTMRHCMNGDIAHDVCVSIQAAQDEDMDDLIYFRDDAKFRYAECVFNYQEQNQWSAPSNGCSATENDEGDIEIECTVTIEACVTVHSDETEETETTMASEDFGETEAESTYP